MQHRCPARIPGDMVLAFLTVFVLGLLVAVGNSSAFSDLSTCLELLFVWYVLRVSVLQSGNTVLRERWNFSLEKSPVSFRQHTDPSSDCCLQPAISSTLSIVDPLYLQSVPRTDTVEDKGLSSEDQSSDWLLVQDLQLEIFFCLTPSIATLASYIVWKE